MSDSQLIGTIQSDFIKDVPEVETGMEVEVHQIIKDGEKERIQIFKGLVIGTRGSSALSHTITVRAEYDGVWIEKVFPIHSPYIQKIVVLRKFQVRHKHIGFVRGLTGKAARLKEIKMNKEAEEKPKK
jgi:large subunit ribosomal protein L19